MKNKNKRRILPLALALTFVLGVGASFAATGNQSDPLISLSYLQQTVLPDILRQVEEKTTQQQSQLGTELAAQITQYKTETQALVGAGSTGSDSYVLVTLTKGQTMYLNLGCEVLLRVGTAKVNADSSPALIDMTSGGTIANGASLAKNHLYLSTIADRTLTPTADTVKLLVRGGYSIT